ncbi:MAG: 16S rRNA (adenine(1518)-N(6)/adenine(1519)-N(6))-dimethyltransferase RsmA [Chloroflexi bacterium]|nr:16S rRNA (adenine(1518)-N(6)/adenine(1519)-N(6))-dimethyltransferase RsmA [Chloroflexota bacterium]
MSVPALLRQHGIAPKKSLGQNFLVDDEALGRIVEAGAVGPDDTILEIGPGVGNLTRHLARAARRVIAVELDGRLIPVLRETLAEFGNVEIIHGDILALPPSAVGRPPSFKVVANIPYYITAPILRHLLESDPRPSLAVLTVQNEVAERICAGPGAMSLLAVSVHFYGEPTIVGRIPAAAFYPLPDVDSAVVRIVLGDRPRIDVADTDYFFRVVKAGFSQKRKQMKNALAAGLRLEGKTAEEVLKASGIEPTRRAETLSLEEWGRLSRQITARLSTSAPSGDPRNTLDTSPATARRGGT